MKVLSSAKLAKTVSDLRNKNNLTQAELADLTKIHRIMIGRIERSDFIPSIVQLQALADVLTFDITDMFITKEEPQSFIALRSENMDDDEKEGFDTLLNMMLALRQQILLQRRVGHGSENRA